ncbi:MAG: SDR family oxidoreductase [Alphaproteobacteria bacterium]|jgi:NAD(P)-dependent dehydrogenase (short-subunit alcohol dehydrogenase family)|nr:SDR family oxidoreductase [Alphaproteobacteria bacterium]
MAEPKDDEGIEALFRLDGQVALVTGAAGGIGAMAAETLTAAGAHVALADLDGAAVDLGAEKLAQAGRATSAYQMDVAQEASVVETVDRIMAAHGRIDVLVNNAGTAQRMPAEEMTLEAWQRVIDVNLTGVFLCAREAGRRMLDAGRGSIVNIASIMGHVGGALYGNLSYHASKGGVVNLTRALAVEWADRGVRVNAIAPTFVDTPFVAGLMAEPGMRAAIEELTPMGRLAQTRDLAGALIYLASPAAAMVTGHSLAVDGGWLAR